MITLKGGATSAAMGIIDLGAQYSDTQAGRVEAFKRASDWVRLGGVAGGILLDRYEIRTERMGRMSKMGGVGAPLFYSSLPLLIRTVGAIAAPQYVPGVGGRRAVSARTAVRAAMPAARVKVPLAPNGARSL